MTNIVKTAEFILQLESEGKNVRVVHYKKSKLVSITVDGMILRSFDDKDFEKVMVYYQQSNNKNSIEAGNSIPTTDSRKGIEAQRLEKNVLLSNPLVIEED